MLALRKLRAANLPIFNRIMMAAVWAALFLVV